MRRKRSAKARTNSHHQRGEICVAAAVDEEDEETLTAIDEGIGDAEADRTIPIEEVRKLLPQWISAS